MSHAVFLSPAIPIANVPSTVFISVTTAFRNTHDYSRPTKGMKFSGENKEESFEKQYKNFYHQPFRMEKIRSWVRYVERSAYD